MGPVLKRGMLLLAYGLGSIPPVISSFSKKSLWPNCLAPMDGFRPELFGGKRGAGEFWTPPFISELPRFANFLF
jgi:hypothetical protein